MKGMNGSKVLTGVCVLGLALFSLAGCTDTIEREPQKYDMTGYLVTSANYKLCKAQIEEYGSLDNITAAQVEQFKDWIDSNISVSYIVTPERNKTQEELVTVVLDSTNISRSQLTTVFEKVNTLGKYVMMFPLSTYYEILFFEKL